MLNRQAQRPANTDLRASQQSRHSQEQNPEHLVSGQRPRKASGIQLMWLE